MHFIIQIILCLILNYYSSINCKKNAELYLEKPYSPAYDILHKYGPVFYIHTPDYLIVITSICVYIKYNVLSCIYLQQNIQSLIYSLLLRSITTQATITSTCMPRPTSNNSHYSQIFVSTHDLMYSGHTIIFIFFGKIMEQDSNIYLYILGNLIQYVFPLSLILSRQHYTNDIIVSIIVYNFFYQYFLSISV